MSRPAISAAAPDRRRIMRLGRQRQRLVHFPVLGDHGLGRQQARAAPFAIGLFDMSILRATVSVSSAPAQSACLHCNSNNASTARRASGSNAPRARQTGAGNGFLFPLRFQEQAAQPEQFGIGAPSMPSNIRRALPDHRSTGRPTPAIDRSKVRWHRLAGLHRVTRRQQTVASADCDHAAGQGLQAVPFAPAAKHP